MNRKIDSDDRELYANPHGLAQQILREKFPGQTALPGLDGQSMALVQMYAARGVAAGNDFFLALEASYEHHIHDEAHLMQVKRIITAIKDVCEGLLADA